MKARLSAALSILSLLAACQMAARTVKAPPLDTEGELWVYLQELPTQAERLRFSVEVVTAIRGDGQEFPLGLSLAEVSGKDDRRQRLLASGRLPPGEYTAVALRVKKAVLEQEEAGSPADLLVAPEPVRVSIAFGVRRAQARVVTLSLQYGRSLDKGFGFRPAFVADVPRLPLVDLMGFVTDTDSDAITVYDKKTRQVAAVLAAGRDPRGLAVDRVGGRLYVALGGGDEVAAYDLVSGEELGRARLRPGDRPQELALGSDGRTLVVTNRGSNSVAFVDGVALVEVGRANAGMQPTALLMDRSGRRAYAFNQGSSNVTVVDVGARAAAGSFPTDGAAVRGAFNRAGDRLYVVTPTSAYMRVLAVPGFASVNQVFVGFDAASVHVDTRTDYVYVSMGDTGEIQLFAPLSPLPVGRVTLPGPATWLSIDDAYDLLACVVPSRKGVAFMDLTSRKVLPLLDTGESPYAAVVVGERR